MKQSMLFFCKNDGVIFQKYRFLSPKSAFLTSKSSGFGDENQWFRR